MSCTGQIHTTYAKIVYFHTTYTHLIWDHLRLFLTILIGKNINPVSEFVETGILSAPDLLIYL